MTEEDYLKELNRREREARWINVLIIAVIVIGSLFLLLG